MELRQLRYFIAVAEELNFRRAARRVFISQPALTHQIQFLERELGARLLVRDRQRVGLTPAGEMFLQKARATVVAAQEAVAAAQSGHPQQQSILRLAVPDWLTGSPISHLVASFTDRALVDLRELEIDTVSAVAALKLGGLDAAFVQFGGEDKTLERLPVCRAAMLLSVPQNHPLASRDRVTLEDLAQERILFRPREWNPGVFDHMKELLTRAGIYQMSLVYPPPEVSHYSAARWSEIAARRRILHFGFSWFPVHPDYVWRQLLPIPWSLIDLVWLSSNDSPALQLFVDHCKDRAVIVDGPSEPLPVGAEQGEALTEA